MTWLDLMFRQNLNFADASQWFNDTLKPDNPISIALLVAFGVMAFIGFRFYVRTREPDGKRIDSFVLTMPATGDLMKVMAYEYPDPTQKPNLEGLKELQDAGELADELAANANKYHYYIIKYEDSSLSTRNDGMALMLMHSRIDDPELSQRLSTKFDIFKGRIHTRLLAQAMDQGRIFDNAVRYDDRMIDLIYYPEMSPTPDDQSKINVLVNPHATLSVAANMREYIEIQKQTKLNEIGRRAAEKARMEAVSEVKRLQDKSNILERLLAKKTYWGRDALAVAGGVSTWVAIGIVGACAVLLPNVINRYMHGHSLEFYIGAAVAIGAALVWFASKLSGDSNAYPTGQQ